MNRVSLLAPLALLVAALSACPNDPPPDNSDTTPPRIRAITPADGAIDISPAAAVTVRFSEDVTASSVSVELSGAGQIVAGTTTVEGSTATFTPSASLAESTEFTFVVKAGYEDAAGNKGEAGSAKFTTAGGLPTVTETSPADGASNVPTTAVMTARFSEPMDGTTLTGESFTLKDGQTAVAGTVSYDEAERVASFTPQKPLLESHTYTATLTTAVKDATGSALAAAKAWSFTTGANVPTVVSITPQNGSTDVAGNAPIKVAFSEEMDDATITDQSFQVAVQGGSAVPGTFTWDSPTHTATFQPTGAYPGGATIVVTLTTAIKDTSGIPLGQEQTASFTISNAPSVTASSPAPNDANVPLSAQVTLTFSEAMDVSTLTQANVYIEDAAGAPVAATYVPAATTVTLSPTAPLEESSVYTVVVTTAVKSATGVPIAAEYRFTFTTEGIAPVVVSVTPAPSASDVPVSTKVRLVFSEDMDQAGFTTANIRLSDGAADVAGAVAAIDAKTAEFTPAAPLRERSSYTVIAGTALTDLKGNALAAEFRATFSTEALPRIVSITPAQNAQNVPAGAAIVLVANKALNAANVTITPPTGAPVNTATLYEEGAVIEGSISYDATTRAIRVSRTTNGAPAVWTAGKRYVLVVDGSKLTDGSGNAVGGVITTTFVAGSALDSTAPSVSSISPQNGQTGASRGAHPYAVFSEDIDPTSLSAANVNLMDGTSALAGRIEYVQAQHKVVFVPASPLPADKQLTFSVGAGIKDPSGNQKTMANVVTFTTQANVEPQLAAISPTDGEVDVEVNRAIRLVFSERIDRSTLVVEVKDGTTALAGSVLYDDATASAVFAPAADWPAGKTLVVTVKAGLKDAEGLATTADIVRSFATIANSAKDVVKPNVTATSPAQSAMGVSARPTIQLGFSEPLDPTTVGVGEFILQEQGGNKVPFGLSFNADADTAVLTPSAQLGAGKIYEVKVQGGIRDLAGNSVDPMAVSSTLTFTVDGTSPTIVSRSPAQNSTVGASGGVELVFSEDMDPSSIDASTFTLTMGSTQVLAAVWYEAGTRTAFLRPATKLVDGNYTAALDGAKVADLAGNTATLSYGFAVSTASPSVVSVTPCGAVIDPDQFGTTAVTLTFDPGVKKATGGALDGTAIQLRINGSAVAATVAHTQGSTTATLTPNAPLNHSTTYEVFVDKNQVVNATTNVPLASSYSCTFDTRKILFADDVDPADTGWSNPTAGANQWIAVDSSDDDPANQTQVWRGGSTVDGTVYNRTCSLTGGTDHLVKLERSVNLFNVSQVELRFDARHEIGDDAQDYFRVVVDEGGIVTALDTFAGTQASYQRRTYDLSSWKSKTVKLRFEVFIDGGTTLDCAARKKGAFVDNVMVVGH